MGRVPIIQGDVRRYWEFVSEFYTSRCWKWIISLFGDDDRAHNALAILLATAKRTVERRGLDKPLAYFRKVLKISALRGKKSFEIPVTFEDLDTHEGAIKDPEVVSVERDYQARVQAFAVDIPEPVRSYALSGASSLRGFMFEHPEFGLYERAKKIMQRSENRLYMQARAQQLL